MFPMFSKKRVESGVAHDVNDNFKLQPTVRHSFTARPSASDQLISGLVADPGYFREGANPKGWCANLLFGTFFAKNCMNMKIIRTKRRRAPSTPLGSASVDICSSFLY